MSVSPCNDIATRIFIADKPKRGKWRDYEQLIIERIVWCSRSAFRRYPVRVLSGLLYILTEIQANISVALSNRPQPSALKPLLTPRSYFHHSRDLINFATETAFLNNLKWIHYEHPTKPHQKLDIFTGWYNVVKWTVTNFACGKLVKDQLCKCVTR